MSNNRSDDYMELPMDLGEDNPYNSYGGNGRHDGPYYYLQRPQRQRDPIGPAPHQPYGIPPHLTQNQGSIPRPLNFSPPEHSHYPSLGETNLGDVDPSLTALTMTDGAHMQQSPTSYGHSASAPQPRRWRPQSTMQQHLATPGYMPQGASGREHGGRTPTIETAEAAKTKPSRSRRGQPRVQCQCICGCEQRYYPTKTMEGTRCAKCRRNQDGACRVPDNAINGAPNATQQRNGSSMQSTFSPYSVGPMMQSQQTAAPGMQATPSLDDASMRYTQQPPGAGYQIQSSFAQTYMPSPSRAVAAEPGSQRLDNGPLPPSVPQQVLTSIATGSQTLLPSILTISSPLPQTSPIRPTEQDSTLDLKSGEQRALDSNTHEKALGGMSPLDSHIARGLEQIHDNYSPAPAESETDPLNAARNLNVPFETLEREIQEEARGESGRATSNADKSTESEDENAKTGEEAIDHTPSGTRARDSAAVRLTPGADTGAKGGFGTPKAGAEAEDAPAVPETAIENPSGVSFLRPQAEASRVSSGVVSSGSAPVYMSVFKSEEEVNAYLAGKEEMEHVTLGIAGDDLNQVTEQEKQDFCQQIFNSLLKAPNEPPEALPLEFQESYRRRQADALKQCQGMINGDEGTKQAIARCDRLYYTAMRLHSKGVPKHMLQKTKSGSSGMRTVSGYTVDWTAKFTARLPKVANAIGGNKRISLDVLTADADKINDLVRAPEAYVKRKMQNFIQNEEKSKDLKEAAKRRQEREAVKGATQLEGGNQTETPPHTLPPPLSDAKATGDPALEASRALAGSPTAFGMPADADPPTIVAESPPTQTGKRKRSQDGDKSASNNARKHQRTSVDGTGFDGVIAAASSNKPDAGAGAGTKADDTFTGQ